MKYKVNHILKEAMRNRIKGIVILVVWMIYNVYTYIGNENIYDTYCLFFDYLNIPTTYAFILLYNINTKIKLSRESVFITRFKSKKDVFVFNVAEIIYESMRFAFVCNAMVIVFSFVYRHVEYNLRTLFFIFINMVSQFILWTIYGALLLLLSTFIENLILACVLAAFVPGFLFISKGHEHTFVYSKYVYDIYDAVVIKPQNLTSDHIFKSFTIHIILILLLFLFAYKCYMNKGIYAEVNNEEA